MLRRLYRALSRRSYNQPSALKPVFGLPRPSLAWRKELRTRQLLHDLPPCRLVASRRPNSAPDHGHLMARLEPHLRAVLAGNDAEAVVFDFV
jgi:hypothetical protein